MLDPHSADERIRIIARLLRNAIVFSVDDRAGMYGEEGPRFSCNNMEEAFREKAITAEDCAEYVKEIVTEHYGKA